MQNEIWKDVKGYEGKYQVSNLGRVKSLDRIIEQYNGYKKFTYLKKGRILKSKVKNSYDSVVFSVNGKHKCRMVHRLVAEAFIENPKNLPEVNHKDGNKSNPHYDNLEWCTSSENQKHACITGLQKTSRGANHYQSKKVIDTNTGTIFNSIIEASNHINKAYPYVSRMLRGKQKNNTNLKFYSNET